MGGVLSQLGLACFRARESAGLRQIDIATVADVTHATVSRFEAGMRAPRDVDRLVLAYAVECGAAPETLWLEAIAEWLAEQNL